MCSGFFLFCESILTKFFFRFLSTNIFFGNIVELRLYSVVLMKAEHYFTRKFDQISIFNGSKLIMTWTLKKKNFDNMKK